MMFSGNGWPASDNPAEIDIVDFVVNGVDFGGVRGGDAYRLLHHVISQVSRRVERANPTLGCYGYNFRPNSNSPSEWSNHASGTAVDFNATRHPNGVPTSQTWSASQIAEIHSILEEVNGAVRWGGDYEGTPDAMHFEINIPPEEIDPDLLSGLPETQPMQGLMGVPVSVPIEDAPLLTEMSVSFPTPAVYTPQGAQWRFIPTETGKISIDALLSHWMDDTFNDQNAEGPEVTLYLYVLNESGSSQLLAYDSYYGGDDPLYPDDRNQGHIMHVTVEAGRTYMIRTLASAVYPWINQVVRIGDYPRSQPWVQPDSVTATFARPNSTGNPNENGGILDADRAHHRPMFGTTPSYNSLLRYNQQEAYSWGPGFTGHSEAMRAFGGPSPGFDSFGRACFWPKARRFAWEGRYWWSKTGSASWNGTDPYDGSVPGYGTCPVADAADYISSNPYSDQAVGTHFYQEAGGFPDYGFNDWHAYTSGVKFKPWLIHTYAQKNGYFTTNNSEIPYLPALSYGEFIEWESTKSELESVRYAPDEVIEWNAGASSSWHVKWYVGLAESVAPGEWGPRWDGDYGYVDWIGRPDKAPESFFGQLDHLTDYAGGPASWRVLPTEYWHPDYWDDMPSNGVIFYCAPPELFSDNPPAHFQNLYETGGSLYAIRSGCYVAIEAVIKPSRFRVVTPPRIPDITWAGFGDIVIDPDDEGRVFY